VSSTVSMLNLLSLIDNLHYYTNLTWTVFSNAFY
jgi:hypothetical protein